MTEKNPTELRAEADELEARAKDLRRSAREAETEQRRVEMERAAAVPVDRSQRKLASGEPVPEDDSHTQLRPNGQQKDYVVLTEAERGKGFVRPFRDAYRHSACGQITTMSRAIAETYARDPRFYGRTFCTTCGEHFPVGESGQFTWYEMDGREGPKVGT